MKIRKRIKQVLFAVAFLLVCVVLLLGWDRYVEKKYQKLIFEMQSCPKTKVALVLGTSKYVKNGGENLFYRHRIDAAYTLYQEKMVEYWIVSGDNGQKEYNEPELMRADLIRLGVPQQRIQPDYAGFRTLDSIYRMEKVFGNTEYLIVSQPFHLARAIFIAKHQGHQVVGCVAKMPPRAYSFKTRVREVFARAKLFLDLYVLNTQAKFYGEPVAFPP